MRKKLFTTFSLLLVASALMLGALFGTPASANTVSAASVTPTSAQSDLVFVELRFCIAEAENIDENAVFNRLRYIISTGEQIRPEAGVFSFYTTNAIFYDDSKIIFFNQKNISVVEEYNITNEWKQITHEISFPEMLGEADHIHPAITHNVVFDARLMPPDVRVEIMLPKTTQTTVVFDMVFGEMIFNRHHIFNNGHGLKFSTESVVRPGGISGSRIVFDTPMHAVWVEKLGLTNEFKAMTDNSTFQIGEDAFVWSGFMYARLWTPTATLPEVPLIEMKTIDICVTNTDGEAFNRLYTAIKNKVDLIIIGENFIVNEYRVSKITKKEIVFTVEVEKNIYANIDENWKEAGIVGFTCLSFDEPIEIETAFVRLNIEPQTASAWAVIVGIVGGLIVLVAIINAATYFLGKRKEQRG